MSETTNGLQVFENNRFGKVRVVMRGGEPWFVAKDVCDCLELGNVSQALDGLDDDEKQQLETNIINPDVGGRGTLIISEPGLYSLVLRSRKPEAKEFKRWVTHDVLPAIRQNGGYMLMRPNETEEEFFARAVLLAQQTLARMDAEKKTLSAKVENLEVELDESKLWWSIKRVAAATGENWREYNWKALKSASFSLGLPPRKIFDANFGAANVYHIDVFERVYPGIKAYLGAVK
ncbi:MAG: phage antirepressor Ant [Oscillospiraceae bacterium]|nr:phage antirepressor Ant [Oscillospiraceae bacterium]